MAPGAVVVGSSVGHRILALTLVLVAACGSLTTQAPPSPTPPPSPLRNGVARLASSLAFDPFVPDDFGAGFDISASLVARPVPRDRPSAPLGEPLLLVRLTLAGGGKTALTMLQGPEDCCAEMVRLTTPVDLTIRASQTGGAPEIRGQLGSPANRNTDGSTLAWLQPAASGRRTYVALLATAFGTQFERDGLLRIARSMRVVDRGTAAVPILLYWSTFTSHDPSGYRLFAGARSAPLPEEARLIDGAGQIINIAPFEPPKAYDCLHAAAGVAAFAVPRDVVEAFNPQRGDSGYRVEARVAGGWMPVELVASGCFATE